MKSQVSPVVAAVVIIIVLLGVGLLLWKNVQGPGGGNGKLQSNLDFSKAEKDPAKLQAKLKEELQKEEAKKGK